MSANGTASPTASLCSCRGCGTTAPITLARVTGSWSVAGNRTDWVCDRCTRAWLRDIEAGLDRAG